MIGKRIHWLHVALALIAIVVVAQVAIVGYAIATDEAEHAPAAPIVPGEQVVETLDLEGAAALGLEIAQAWRADAELVDAGMQVDWPVDSAAAVPTELPRGGWAVLSYLSGRELLTMRMDRASGVVVDTELLRLSESVATQRAAHAVDLARAALSSTEAVLLTEATYGHTYRSACPELRRRTSVSVHRENGQIAWYVSYLDQNSIDRTTLSVLIDWTTGRIYDGVNLAPSCES